MKSRARSQHRSSSKPTAKQQPTTRAGEKPAGAGAVPRAPSPGEPFDTWTLLTMETSNGTQRVLPVPVKPDLVSLLMGAVMYPREEYEQQSAGFAASVLVGLALNEAGDPHDPIERMLVRQITLYRHLASQWQVMAEKVAPQIRFDYQNIATRLAQKLRQFIAAHQQYRLTMAELKAKQEKDREKQSTQPAAPPPLPSVASGAPVKTTLAPQGKSGRGKSPQVKKNSSLSGSPKQGTTA